MFRSSGCKRDDESATFSVELHVPNCGIFRKSKRPPMHPFCASVRTAQLEYLVLSLERDDQPPRVDTEGTSSDSK